MKPEIAVAALMTFLHNLFTALWIGGMLALALAVMPAAKKIFAEDPRLKRFSEALQSRLSRLAIISMAGLALTGILLSRREERFTGFFGFSSLYASLLSLKHIAMLAMVAVALLRNSGLKRQEGQPSSAAQKRSAALLVANIGLGLLVLLLSGFLAVLP